MTTLNVNEWAVLIPAICTGVALLAGSISGIVLSWRNGKKADAIHVLVNSGMSKALADNAAQAEELRTLRALVQSLNERIVAPAGDRPSRADVELAHATLDASRLPSAAVLAAQALTPKVAL